MRLREKICVPLVCCALICGLGLEAAAVDFSGHNIVDFSSMSSEPLESWQEYEKPQIAPRATIKFDIQVSADSAAAADTSFPLEAGETVTINAAYSPSGASVDFGLIAPDGLFHYINTTSGSINKTIRVDEWGDYTLAVRNNSSRTVSVVGFVNY